MRDRNTMPAFIKMVFGTMIVATAFLSAAYAANIETGPAQQETAASAFTVLASAE